MRLSLLEKLLTARAENRPIALVTDLATGLQTLVHEKVVEGDFGVTAEESEAIADLIATESSALVGDSHFVQSFAPAARLVLVGAVHIAQALIPMAQALGYGITVIDPRQAFATPGRFPGIALSTDWPDEALEALKPDSRTAIVTLTHDPKLDDPALQAALKSDAFYIGALGSRKTHASRVQRLAEAGFSEGDIARIQGPVGLPIGAKTQAEIALSILAQITAARRLGKTAL